MLYTQKNIDNPQEFAIFAPNLKLSKVKKHRSYVK
jgi:hypothetical protein